MKSIKYSSKFIQMAVLYAISITLLYAHQPTPPVSLSLETKQSDDSSITAIVIIKPNIEISDAKLIVITQDGLKADPKSQEIRLDALKEARFEVKLQSDQKQPLRVDFEVQANAKNYLRAGGKTRRYFVKNRDGKVELVTGSDLRDRFREKTLNEVESRKRKSPELGQTIYDALTGPLVEVDINKVELKESQPQLLAPPAGGIEELERDTIKDSTEDNIRDVDPITVTGKFFYVDRNGITVPLVNATVDIRDDDTFGDEQLTSVVTGWDGSYSAVVNADDGWLQNGRDIYARVRTTNSRFRVQDCGFITTTYSWTTEVRDNLPDGAVVDFGNLQPASDMDAAIMFQDMNAGWNHMTTTGSQDPGFVNLCWPEGATNYDFSNVNVTDGDEVAEDVVLHEYGHAIMHNAYNNSYWPANAVGPHTFCDTTPQNQNLSFTEGWATFVALSVNPDGVYDSASWSWDLENNSCSNAEGKRDETMVAAGLIDMRDSASDGNCSSGDCDPSGTNNVSMVDLWRDTVFSQNIDHMDEYWDVLCPELNEAQHDDGIDSLDFNNIDVPACQCTAELALASSDLNAERAGILDSLREFRDVGLKKTTVGRRMVQHYYSHHREASKLILSNPSVLKDAAMIFQHVAKTMDEYALGKGQDKPLLDESTRKSALELVNYLKEKASPEFLSAITEAEQFIEPSSKIPLSRMKSILDRPSPK